MLITYLRSSSLGQWKLCQWSYALQYVMGLRSPANRRADQGNAAHKALELYARQRLAELRGEATYTEPESGRVFRVGELTPESAVDFGWSVYQKPDYTKADKREVYDLVCKTLAYKNGECHPQNLEVVQPEQFFDLELPYGWAAYSHENPFGGPRIEGQLRIRGTVDLLYRDEFGLLVYLDWKSGRKWDWAAGKEKTYDSLLNGDDQLSLYYYALRRLYPADNIMMAIHFMKADGTTYLPYGDEHLEAARRMMQKAFEEIRDCERPTRRMDECGPRGQPCSFCHLNKTKTDDGQSLCDYYWGELQQLGMTRLVQKHGKPDGYDSYGGGGGQTDRMAKPG